MKRDLYDELAGDGSSTPAWAEWIAVALFVFCILTLFI